MKVRIKLKEKCGKKNESLLKTDKEIRQYLEKNKQYNFFRMNKQKIEGLTAFNRGVDFIIKNDYLPREGTVPFLKKFNSFDEMLKFILDNRIDKPAMQKNGEIC